MVLHLTKSNGLKIDPGSIKQGDASILLNKPASTKSFSRMAITFIFVFLLFPFTSTAAEVKFTASAPSVVTVGEQFRLTYTVNIRTSDLRLPDLGNFQLLSGPGTSSSSSVQIINGEVTQTQSVSFTYVLRATETGNYTIGPATITAGPDSYVSNPLKIEVVSDSEGRRAVADRPPESSSSPDISGEDIFVRILTDKNELYQGEGVVATFKLYSKLDLTGIENVRFPALNGFYQQEIETPPLRNLDREVINGVIYGTGILKQVILFPQRNGDIRIEPFEMEALVRQRSGRRSSLFDDFLGNFETRRIPVQSPPLSLKVKPLPPDGPPGYSGGVGNFSLNARVTPEKTKTNEAITLHLTISGKGNLKLLKMPQIQFPRGLEVYDPRVNESITNSSRGQEGSITYEYLIIPRSEGRYTIPAVEMTYFDPATSGFRRISSGEFDLLVEKGNESEAASTAGYAREEVRIVGSDIRFIKTTGVVLKKIGSDPFGTFSFYLWFILPLVIFTAFIALQNKNIRDRADAAGLRNRRASKMARQRLKTAGRYLKEDNSQQFFEETLKALWGYLSDKLLIPVSDLKRQNARSALMDKKIPEHETDRLIGIIDECEFARYAPPSLPADKSRIYNDSVQLITLIEQTIKLK
jgi:hypothetical protein